MAIGIGSGVTASNSTAATSLATASYSSTGGRDILVAVAIAASGVTVSSVTDTAGDSFSLKSSVTNSGNVRAELWQAQNVAGNGSNVVTVNVSGSSLLAVAVQEYSGTANTTFAPLDRTGWVANSNDQYYGAAANAIDGNTGSIWATNGTIPCWLTLDMLASKTFTVVTVLPRQDGWNDWPGDIQLLTSTDGVTYGTTIYSTTGLPGSASLKTFSFSSVTTRYLKYNISAIASGSRIYQGAAEVNVGSAASVPSQNTWSNTGSDYFARARGTPEDTGGFLVAAFAFSSSSGDTFTGSTGTTIRQSVVPALTSVAVALGDVVNPTAAPLSLPLEARLSASRQWAVAAAELRTGTVTSGVYADYTGALPVDGVPLQKEQRFFGTMPSFATSTPIGSVPAPVAVVILSGVVGVGYNETITTAGGTGPFTYSLATGSLPAGTTLSSAGLISGIPTTATTYSFTVTSVDSGGHSGTQAFQITILTVAAPHVSNTGFAG